MNTKKTLIIALVALASVALGYQLLGLGAPRSSAEEAPTVLGGDGSPRVIYLNESALSGASDSGGARPDDERSEYADAWHEDDGRDDERDHDRYEHDDDDDDRYERDDDDD